MRRAAILVGAGAYQRIALIADWTRNLPQSLTDYFRNQAAAQSIGRFCTSVLPPTALLTLLAFAVNWRDRSRRRWSGLALLLFFGALVWTAVWFVPKGVIPLFERDGAGMTGQKITHLAKAWIFWDWFRMGMIAIAYFSLVRACSGSASSRSGPPDLAH